MQEQNKNSYNSIFRSPNASYKTSNAFASASLFLGLASIMTCSCLYGAYIFGSLAIIFACLSRGKEKKMTSGAKIGLSLAICGIMITTIFYAISFYLLLKEYGSIEGILRSYCEIYGYDFETLFGDLY